jgi:hypothetical protein
MKTGINVAKAAASVAAAALFAVRCAAAGGAERPLVKGECPAFSPDGSRIAFHRLENDIFKLGVVPVKGGDVEWIEEGPGNAAHAAWSPDGALVYTAGYDTETAFQGWKANSKNGYGLRLWKDGKKRDITGGRWRDYTPSFSPDGKKLYFTTTRGWGDKKLNQATSAWIACYDFEKGGEPEILLDFPGGRNNGVVQPAVSPDGKFIFWSRLENCFDHWRICGARLDRLERDAWRDVTPERLSALAPRWHPNGRLICFTGFLKRNSGWGVWVEDVRTRKVKRLATGENPCFSPDGKTIAYDRDGMVYLRPFGAGDMPDAVIDGPDAKGFGEEKILWSAENITEELTVDLGEKGLPGGTPDAVFVRVRVKLDGTASHRDYVTMEDAFASQGLHLFSRRSLWFSTRIYGGRDFGTSATGYEKAGEYVFTGVRVPEKIYVAIDGCEPYGTSQPGSLRLRDMRTIVLGRGLKNGESIIKAEIGAGWPANVSIAEKPLEDLFK